MSAAATSVESRLNLSNTKQHLSKLVNQVARGETRVVIEKSGLPVAAIISMEAYERFQQMEGERARRFAALDRISKALSDLPVETIEAEVERAIAESRERYRTSDSRGS
jgi:prevent-host-death family protein